jgi:tetratricopeptide (TPR) repeat protein
MTPLDVRELCGKAYLQAARADANMRQAVSAVEAVRECFTAHASYHDVLDAINEQIGQADLDRLVPALCELRQTYWQWIVDAEAARLRQAFEQSPEHGWATWIETYAGLFQEKAWHTDIGHRLALDAVTAAPDPAWPLDRVRRMTWHAWHDGWPEAYDWFLYLADQAIPASLRARMLAIAAEIQMYRFLQPTAADILLERAERLPPREILTVRARAELWFQRKDIAGARRRYQELVESWPRLADGYIGLAECAEEENDTVAAEAFYQQAVQFAPGMSSSHRNLLTFYGKRLVAEGDELVQSIFQRLLAVSDDPACEWLTLGQQYHKARHYDRARELFGKVLERHADYGLAHVWLGHTSRDQAAEGGAGAEALRDRAITHYRRDIELRPESLDGYWGMSDVCAARRDWAGAAEWAERGRQCHPQWDSFVQVRLGALAAERGDLAAAEDALHRSIAREPQNPSAYDVLIDLADKFADAKKQIDKAEALAAEWRQYKGDAVEYLHQNRLGNWRYAAGDYHAAAEHYQRAVLANPSRPVVQSNLALAAEHLRAQDDRKHWLDVGIVSLTHAVRLDPRDESYRTRLARLTAERDVIDTYGEPALAVAPTVPLIAVDVPEQMLPQLLDAEGRDLSKETIARIEHWRLVVRETRGIPLPGIRFRQLPDGSAGDVYYVTFGGREPLPRILGDLPAIDLILSEVEALYPAHATELVGHQETANLLRMASGEHPPRVLDTPQLLTGFVMHLTDLISRGMPITEIADLARGYLESHQGRAAAALADVAEPARSMGEA